MTEYASFEREGIVSVWIGKAASQARWEDTLRVSFSVDGEFLGSDFSRTFGVGYYDDSFKESLFHDEPPGHIEDYLRGVSYEEVVVPALISGGMVLENGDNVFVALYNIAFSGVASTVVTGDVSLRFVGHVRYVFPGLSGAM